jgi:hypothetical protein
MRAYGYGPTHLPVGGLQLEERTTEAAPVPHSPGMSPTLPHSSPRARPKCREKGAGCSTMTILIRICADSRLLKSVGATRAPSAKANSFRSAFAFP